MLYTRLISRGVLRHNKKGKRLFILLTLCTAAIIFALSFNESFYVKYVDLGIDTKTAHLQVVSPDSIWLKKSFWGAQREELPLIRIDADFAGFVKSLAEVEKASPVLEAEGLFFTVEGEMQRAYDITGVRPDDLPQILPGIQIVKGMADFKYQKGMKDIPFLRWNIQRWEVVENNDKFLPKDFRLTGKDFDDFKSVFKKDFPTLLKQTDYTGGSGTDNFLADLNKALPSPDIYKLVPESYTENYNYHIDDLITRLKTMSGADAKELAKWNKRLFQAIYEEVITPVPEEVSLDTPMTLMVSPAKSTAKINTPKIIPVKFVGFVEGMPLYYAYNFIDISVLQEYLELSPDECTGYFIRLKDKSDTEHVKIKIRDYLQKRGLDYRVIDYKFIGEKMHMPTATAFSLILNYLIILFMVIVIFFIVNSVMLSIIKRRKEVGTAITLGMSKNENVLIFVGEMLVLVTISWLAGSLLGSLLVFLFAQIGIPGIVFMQGGKLFLMFKVEYLFAAYAILLPTAVFASLLPSLTIRRAKVVELLKGELSKKAESVIFLRGARLLTLKLALRNIFSHKLRSLIIFIVIAFVSMLLFFFLSFSDGEIANFRNGLLALWNPPADIMVLKKGFLEARERNEKSEDLTKMTIPDYQELREELLQFDFIKNVYYSPYMLYLDIFIGGHKYKWMRFRGTDVRYDDSVTSRVTMVSGSMFKPGEKNRVILNIIKKEEFNVEPGQTVTLVGKDLFGQAVAEDFVLAGYFQPNIDNPNLSNTAFVDMEGYRLISGYFENEAGSLRIDLNKGYPLAGALSALNAWAAEKGKDIEFHDFYRVNKYDNDVYGMVRVILIVTCFIVVFIVMFGIMNIVSVNLFDRKKEIGTFYCLGAEKPFLIIVYSLEILLVNLFAAIIGIGAGLGISFLINSLKITSTNPGVQLVFGGSTFYLGISLSTMVWLLIGIALVTFLTALTTLGSSLRVRPIEAVREIEE
jgi:ABC-type lipoprotein release transport system permease subunit